MTTAYSKGGRSHIVKSDLAGCLTTLAQVERRLDPIRSDQPIEAPFRVIGSWLVREEILSDRLRWGRFRKTGDAALGIPGIPVGNFLSASRSLLFARRVHANTTASAVFVKGNVRAFYIDREPLTLWVGLPPFQPELAATIAIRSRFVADSRLKIPRVITQDTEATPPYVLEELVSGRRFGLRADWAALGGTLMPPLFRFYDQGIIRHGRAAEIYDEKQIAAEIVNVFQKLRWKKRWVSRARFLEAAKQCLDLSDETLPLCIGHGDLGKSNLLVTGDGGIALLDWEQSQELPIAADLVKLVRGHHQLLHRLSPEVRQRTENPDAMPPNRQFLLATLERIAALASRGLGDSGPRAVRSVRSKKARLWLDLASFLIREPR